MRKNPVLSAVLILLLGSSGLVPLARAEVASPGALDVQCRFKKSWFKKEINVQATLCLARDRCTRSFAVNSGGEVVFSGSYLASEKDGFMIIQGQDTSRNGQTGPVLRLQRNTQLPAVVPASLTVKKGQREGTCSLRLAE